MEVFNQQKGDQSLSDVFSKKILPAQKKVRTSAQNYIGAA